MLVLGDAHAADPDRRDALRRAYEVTDEESALQVGDLQYYDLPRPTWFVAGNNEDFDVIERLRDGESPDGVRNAHLLASTAADVAGLRVAGLSGNYAPTKFERSRSDLEGDRRRHFTSGDVDRLADLGDVDVLLTHEAPTGLLYYGYDPGCEHVNGLLSATDPDLCLVGHHHRHEEARIEDVRVVSLAPVWEQYYLLDPADLSLLARDSPD